jgi:hypothetical protein
LVSKPSVKHFFAVLRNEHDVVSAVPPNVRLTFPFSHGLFPVLPNGPDSDEPFSLPLGNPGSVEPFRVSPPEAAV